LAIGLAALEVALKEAPMRGWTSGLVAGLLALSFASAFSFVRRTLSASRPIVSLATFADRSFAIGCVLSFVLGVGLFGSVYLMPVFLAFVRGHNALEIGAIMLVVPATPGVWATRGRIASVCPLGARSTRASIVTRPEAIARDGDKCGDADGGE